MLGNSAFIEMNIGILTKHFLVFHAQQCYGVPKNLLTIVARVGFWTNLTFHTTKEGIYGYAFLFIRHFFSYLHKGQVISQQNFGVFNFQKKNEIVPLFFWFDDPSLEARAETKKIRWFLENWPKFRSEITRPLVVGVIRMLPMQALIVYLYFFLFIGTF